MTVKAFIMTTRALNDNGRVSLQFSNNTNDGSMVDVWFVTISESLSNKTNDEISEILDIRDYGVWITSPYENKFWIVSYLSDGFNVEELSSATFNDVYDRLEIDSLLEEKADIDHIHSIDDISDLNEKINLATSELAEEVNFLMDNLAEAFFQEE